MNIGIIGAGRIAEKLAMAINNVDGASLYSISSRSLSKARAFAEKFNVTTWYEGTEDFFKDEKLDIVYIATPNSSHYQDTINSLNSGKAVLCEKPFALDIEEAKEMVALAKKKNLLLVEAMWSKYFPALKKVKKIVDSGLIGEIKTIQGDLSYPLGRDKERLYRKDQGGGALLDLGVYPISITHYFLGKPDKIVAESKFTPEGVDESTSMIFKYNSGATALLTCSISAMSSNEFIICGTEGWVRLNGSFHHSSSISSSTKSTGEQHEEFPRSTDGYEYQIQGLLEDFNNKKVESSTVSYSDTLEIMEIMDEIRGQVGYSFK
ncbi:MAG: Gfo/Idh/MocA family oxidoreductase [Spirochaetales bacterium]|nr:Gfo/Idh/MocA family oxidoreductase [Spirochaetales bacterium]